MKTLTEIKKVRCFNRLVLQHVAMMMIQTFPYILLKMWMEIIPVPC